MATAKVRPPPPTPSRRTVAWLACTYLAMAAIDSIFFLFVATMWLFFWGQASKELGRLVCGEGCAVVTAAYEVASVAAGVILVLLLPFGVLLLALMIARNRKQAATATDDSEATKEPVPIPKTSNPAMRDALCDPVTLGFLALMEFAVLKLIGVLVKGDSPEIRSRRERMGSVIYDVGALGKNALNCFFLCPVLTVWIWRPGRKARHAL